MRFTRLRLNGFKSFVDPTDLVIHDGLTGVVGPNGCGKSNLLEALRWVMGENRPTAMRGGGMEDVIFAGAATRSTRNFAEVALWIDNADRVAPAAFNDADMLEIVRRITRDAGSAYKVNSRDVRARDVQMLFADAATGSQSPALVRQGQISELINAKPRARRRILEDAAGIGGLYQRRHEAELKLNAAEQNLGRVQDVVDQLTGQLGQLARQAKQAARYRQIGAELRDAEGMLLYRRWHDADMAACDAAAAAEDRARAADAADRAALAAAAARETAEAALPALRDEDAVATAIRQKLEGERAALDDGEARARGAVKAITARIAQLDKDAAREEALNRDAGETIARLDAERRDLAAEGADHEERLHRAAEAARVAAAHLAEREEVRSRESEAVAALAARHQAAARAIADARRLRDAAEAEAAKASAAVDAAETVLAGAAEAVAAGQAAQGEAVALAERAEAALAAADAARAEVQGAEAEARAARSSAEGELGALKAETAALARLVARDANSDGQLLDLLRVEPGYEKALGAALADDLRAPALAPGLRSGWGELADYDRPQPLPGGVQPLAAHVAAPALLRRRLDQIGLVGPEQGPDLQPALRPGQRLVSRAGDLWRWDGYRAAAEDAPSAAALRLEQRNRLEELERQTAEAETAAQATAEAHQALKARLEELTHADARAREARKTADARAADAGRALSRAEADRTIADSRLESQRLAVARHRDEATAARTRLAEAERTAAALDDLDAARAGAEAAKAAVEGMRITMMTARAEHDDLRRAGEARDRRLREVERDLETWQGRLANAGQRVGEIEHRRAASQSELEKARAVPDRIAAERQTLERRSAETERRAAAAAAALAAGEAALRDAAAAEREAARRAGEAREARAAADARSDAAQEAAAAAAGRIAEEQETTPGDLAARLGDLTADLPDVAGVEALVARLRQQRDALGAVNLRAEEDAAEIRQEYEALTREKTDLEEAIRALRSGIGSLNREGRERLLTAFEQVNSNFTMLFRHLFNGGEARLELVESDDPLEAGLEIMCQPPGKKLSTLSLLSGGEQTLTALALIFAVFLANPSPICVLDEVDAPLDDANVTRFCDLLDEMTRQTETRFLIITHHAVTMARMDRLFGVTMGEQGVSQLVSVDLKKAEQMVA